MMQSYKYVIVGGGMTADAAVRGIRELDSQGTIAIVGEEHDQPYARPPLSKGMWKGRPFEKIWRGTDQLNVDLHTGRTALRLDPAGKHVRDDRGDVYAYDKLLLATGGTPRRLAFGNGHIIYYRTLRDYERLRALAETGNRFLVIGGGLIGSEIAAALRMQGKEVALVLREASIGASLYPQDLSSFLSDFYRKKGVDVVARELVVSVDEIGSTLSAGTRAGRSFEVDGVVAGIGIRPNVELARSAGLANDNGIVVDERTRTSAPDIFAAGDVAKFPHAALGKLVRVEHEDNALQMGKQAGRNMAGAGEAYAHVPYFYSDLFELGYEAVGDLSSSLETFEDWSDPFQKGVVYYLDGGRVRGVLLWNVWEKVKQAAALLAEPGPFSAENLKGRIAA
jgi:3-phenylpropionate/trans-cinnamate dioxygenase ferredoxin reductase subunit